VTIEQLTEQAARLLARARLEGFDEASSIAYDHVGRDVQERIEERGRELEDAASVADPPSEG
jgi:GAF domain-containing protein